MLNWQILRLAMIRILAAALAVTGFVVCTPAEAHQYTRDGGIEAIGPEASGCYFSRGEMFCGRYCYVEINGRRYCQVRERDAYPQGDVYIEEAAVPLHRARRHHHSVK